MIDDRDTIAQTLGFLHIVRGQDDRSPFRLELGDEVPELATRLRIESGGRLVEKQQLRIPDERAGDGEPLLLAAGQGPDARQSFLTELDLIDDLADVARLAVEALEEGERLVDGQLLGELGILELDAEQLAQLVLVRFPPAAEDLDAPRIRREKSLADLDGGRFSGAVRPKQSKALARQNLELEAVDGDDVVVRLAEALNPECGCRRVDCQGETPYNRFS